MALVVGGGHGGGHGCGGGVSSGGHGSAGSGLYSETIKVVVGIDGGGEDGEKVEVVVALMAWVIGVENVVVVAIVVVMVVATMVTVVATMMVTVVVTMIIFCFF